MTEKNKKKLDAKKDEICGLSTQELVSKEMTKHIIVKEIKKERKGILNDIF